MAFLYEAILIFKANPEMQNVLNKLQLMYCFSSILPTKHEKQIWKTK